MGCYNYSNGLFKIQVKLPKNWVLITHLFFQCTRKKSLASIHTLPHAYFIPYRYGTYIPYMYHFAWADQRVGMGDTSTKILISILYVLDT